MKRIRNTELPAAYPWLLAVIGKSALWAQCQGVSDPCILLRHWLERFVAVYHDTTHSCNTHQFVRMHILPGQMPMLENYFFVQRVHFYIFFHAQDYGSEAYTHFYAVPWGGILLQDCLTLLSHRNFMIDAIVRNNLLTNDKEECVADSYIIYD